MYTFDFSKAGAKVLLFSDICKYFCIFLQIIREWEGIRPQRGVLSPPQKAQQAVAAFIMRTKCERDVNEMRLRVIAK